MGKRNRVGKKKGGGVMQGKKGFPFARKKEKKQGLWSEAGCHVDVDVSFFFSLPLVFPSVEEAGDHRKIRVNKGKQGLEL